MQNPTAWRMNRARSVLVSAKTGAPDRRAERSHEVGCRCWSELPYSMRVERGQSGDAVTVRRREDAEVRSHPICDLPICGLKN